MNKSKLVSNTQIYLDCRKLLDEILDITPSFPRAYKFSIGNKMHDIGVDLISEISAAYINRDKQVRIQHLVNFQSEFEVVVIKKKYRKRTLTLQRIRDGTY